MADENPRVQSDILVKPKATLEQGFNEVLSALANNDKAVEAMAALLGSIAAKPSIENEFRKRTHIIGTCFSALIFVGVGVMGYLKVIPADGTMGLLGALIGYWYGQRQKG
jgi:hypothetical protein